MELRDNIKGVQHLGIPVCKMEETKKFYIENFGFEVIHEKEIFNGRKQISLHIGARLTRNGVH